MGLVADIVFLGAAKVAASGVALWEAFVPLTGDSDVESFGFVDVFQSLGIASSPWPKTDAGYAEAIGLRGCGGKPLVCIAARDTRTAKIVGNLQPGDTVVHSTGPEQAAQLQLKETKRQAALVTRGSNGKTMALILDGVNDKVQITARKAIFEIDENGDVSIINASGCGILIQGENVKIVGTPQLGGGNVPGLAFMLGPPTGSPGGAASVPLFAAKGVAPGT